MLIAYVSLGTKNTEELVKLLGVPSIDLETVDTINMDPISEPFVLAVPSYENASFYDILADVLEADEGTNNCKGIIGSGNRNFGDLYLVTAKELSRDYKVPIVYELEFYGTNEERKEVLEVLDYLDGGK